MSTGVMNVPNGFVVVTHVQPVGNENGQVAVPTPAVCLGQTASTFGQSIKSAMEKFRKGHPVALGTVQIMIGLLQLLIGIVMAISAEWLGVYSGIFVWGSLIYIIAGSLTVAAGNKINRCLVNGSMGMNIVASLTATCGVILYCFDASGILLYYCSRWEYSWECDTLRVRSQGISVVMVIFSLLELVISIYVSAFACKATCNPIPEQQVFITVGQSPQASAVAPQVLTPATNQSEVMPIPKDLEGLADPTLAQVGERPPQYTPF